MPGRRRRPTSLYLPKKRFFRIRYPTSDTKKSQVKLLYVFCNILQQHPPRYATKHYHKQGIEVVDKDANECRKEKKHAYAEVPRRCGERTKVFCTHHQDGCRCNKTWDERTQNHHDTIVERLIVVLLLEFGVDAGPKT